MPAPEVLTNATIWLGGYNMTGASNEITYDAARQEIPDNRFGDTLEGFYPGPLTVAAEVKGFFDSTLDDPLTGQLLSPTTTWPLTICPNGGDDGEVAYNIQGYTFGYSVLEAPWGQSLPFRLSNKPASGTTLDRGLVALPNLARTATATGVKRQLGAISATQKMVVVLHVFAITGGTWTLTIESDADSSAGGETVRDTFTAVTTAPGRQVREIAGAVTDTWWRAVLTETIAGGVTAAVSFAIVEA